MKETIINILVFVIFFSLFMIIFPEGKTQKYCKLVIKLFLFIYILNSTVLNSAISLDSLLEFTKPIEDSSGYTREIDLSTSNQQFIDLINKNLYSGEEVVKNIIVNFTHDMKLDVSVYVNTYLTTEEMEALAVNVSDIFNIKSENVKITY